MAKTTKKKPNRRDLTLRNLDAQKKRDAPQNTRLDRLEARNLKFGPRIQRLEEQVRAALDTLAHVLKVQQEDSDRYTRLIEELKKLRRELFPLEALAGDAVEQR